MHVEYRSATPRARVLIGSLGLWAVTAIVCMLAHGGRLDILARVSTGAVVPVGDASASDLLVTVASWLVVGAYLLAGVATLSWLHRVVENESALAAHGATAAMGAGSRWRLPLASPQFAVLSLALFVVIGIGGYAVSLAFYQIQDPYTAIVDSSLVQITSMTLAAVVALVVVAGVSGVRRRQEAAANVIGSGSFSAAPPREACGGLPRPV